MLMCSSLPDGAGAWLHRVVVYMLHVGSDGTGTFAG